MWMSVHQILAPVQYTLYCKSHCTLNIFLNTTVSNLPTLSFIATAHKQLFTLSASQHNFTHEWIAFFCFQCTCLIDKGLFIAKISQWSASLSLWVSKSLMYPSWTHLRSDILSLVGNEWWLESFWFYTDHCWHFSRQLIASYFIILVLNSTHFARTSLCTEFYFCLRQRKKEKRERWRESVD